MASSYSIFFDEIRSKVDVDPPQNEESTDVGELVNDPAFKPNGTVSSSVRELLECPVCLNAMYPPIHQCSNGHTICSGCKPRVHNRCPTCRHELGNIRCLALEKVAASLELPCKYQGFGCSGIYPYYSKIKHESQCAYRPYNCPYAGSECSIMGDIPYLVAHLKDDHKVDMHNGSTFNHRYVKSNPQEVENATWMLTVAAYSDGNVRVFELLDPLELRNWQLQAEFQNVIESVSEFGKASCLSASISWNPQKSGSQESCFLIGFNSNTPELNSSKVWEFDQAHQRWLPVAELALPEDKGDQVYAVAWAPNIGRPYEIIAVATHKGLAIWHLGLNPDHDGRLPIERVALLSGHEGMVWQMEWDMSGMTLATTGHDGLVRLWQSNLNGVWHQQAAFEPTS